MTDSRQVDRFGEILRSPAALQYLNRAESPLFETAYRYAGGDVQQLVALVERAADDVEEALGTAHHHSDSPDLQRAVRRLAKDVRKLTEDFPDAITELNEGVRD